VSTAPGARNSSVRQPYNRRHCASIDKPGGQSINGSECRSVQCRIRQGQGRSAKPGDARRRIGRRDSQSRTRNRRDRASIDGPGGGRINGNEFRRRHCRP
jgi:hypothetical protein